MGYYDPIPADYNDIGVLLSRKPNDYLNSQIIVMTHVKSSGLARLNGVTGLSLYLWSLCADFTVVPSCWILPCHGDVAYAHNSPTMVSRRGIVHTLLFCSARHGILVYNQTISFPRWSSRLGLPARHQGSELAILAGLCQEH